MFSLASIRRSVLYLCASLVGLVPAFGQAHPGDVTNPCNIRSHEPSQNLTGTVFDASGARITSATIYLVCGEVKEQAHTDAKGAYLIKAAPGIYSLQIEAPGFAVTTQQVTLGSATSVVDLILAVRQASNSVSVSADVGYVAVQSTAGTKTNTPLIEVPQAVSVVTRDQMDEQGIQSVPQALRYTSGIVAEQGGVNADAYETIHGRGFQLEEYLDGLRFPDMGYLLPSFDPFNLESIEVLHGPASVLYGQAYPAGIVNLVSKQPRHETYRNLQFTTGAYNRYQGAWDFSGPLRQSEALFYRIAGMARHADTQVTYVEEERIAIAPALTWQPDENTSLTVLLDYQHDPKVGFYNFYPAIGTLFSDPNGIIPTSLDVGDPDFDKHSRRQYTAGYLFTHRFDNTWSVQQNLRYIHLTDNLDNLYVSGLLDDNATLTRYSFINHEHVNETTMDTRATADLNHGRLRQTIVMGVDYQAIPYVEGYGFDFTAPSLNAFAPVYSQSIPYPTLAGEDHVNQYQVGIYGQDQIQYNKWAFSLGGREDFAGIRDHERVSNTLQTQFDHASTGRAGVVYLFDHGISPYFSYSTSFQPEIGTNYENQTFKPTTGQQYEVGLKYQPSNVSAFVTLSAFNLTEQNVTTTDSAHPQFSTQTGEIRSRGVELEGHANLTNNLNLIASYSFVDNVVTKSNDTAAAYGDNLGKTPYGIPQNTAALWADYTVRRGPISGLNLGSGVRLVGQTYGDNLNTFKVPSFTLVDTVARYDLKALSTEKTHWQLSVNASNLADRRYVSVCSSTIGCNYGLRRNILGKVDFKW